MARKKPDPAEAGPNWYLQDWLRHLGVTQAELGRRAGWSVATVHDIYHGKTDYYREIVNRIAAALEVEPFELLMPPAQAMAFAGMREASIRIVHGGGRDYRPEPAERSGARR